MKSDSAQYHTAPSPTPRSIPLRGVRLCAVLDNFGFSNISISRHGGVWYCAESHLAQCDSARSPTWQSIILRGVPFFFWISPRKRIFSETIVDCLSGTQIGSIHEKKMKKILWHCLFKKTVTQEKPCNFGHVELKKVQIKLNSNVGYNNFKHVFWIFAELFK